MNTALLERFLLGIDKIPLVDTHEHFMSEEERGLEELDVFYLFGHYASSDAVSAGLPIRKWDWLRDPKQPLAERWALFSRFWDRARNTTQSQAILIALKDLFHIDDLNDSTYEAVSEKLVQSKRTGWYRHVLHEKAGIELSIQDVEVLDVDRELFVPVGRYDRFIMASSRQEIWDLEQRTGIAIHSLDDLLRSIDIALERGLEAGIVGVKIAVAYQRPLKFNKAAKHDAEVAFNSIAYNMDPLRVPICGPNGRAWEELKPMQDYIVHHIIRRSIDCHLPIQVHTGFQEGNSNYILYSNPTLMANVFMEYPEAQFDIFHGGYPYCSELATLAKNFRNVYIDMCWFHIISPSAARRALHEWIETVPLNKILAFGGDYGFVEGAYGHSRIARRNVARVLAEKVEEGYFTEEQGLQAARRVFYDNPRELFRLG